MLPRRFSICAAVVALSLSGQASASLVQINLALPDLVLKNGAKYHDLTIRTFDPAIGRVMVQTGKAFTTVAIELMPDDVAARLRTMTPPGATEPEKPSTVVPVPYTPPAQTTHERYTAAPDEANTGRQQREESSAQAAIVQRAQNYFRYECRAGSNSITLRSLRFEWQRIEQIQGWTGRYQMAGKAYLDYYDSVGQSFSRTTKDFDISAEVDARGNTKIVDMNNH